MTVMTHTTDESTGRFERWESLEIDLGREIWRTSSDKKDQSSTYQHKKAEGANAEVIATVNDNDDHKDKVYAFGK